MATYLQTKSKLDPLASVRAFVRVGNARLLTSPLYRYVPSLRVRNTIDDDSMSRLGYSRRFSPTDRLSQTDRRTNRRTDDFHS